ncbi:MAG: insulinase family protein, partial [Myxococcota bacterium]|nr:insulinase family protein [Myxococcota bacterium]
MISLFLFLSCAPKQAALSPEPYPANEIIPTSPVLDTGTLQNGLQYYIRENNTPNNRAELRLVIRAGSVLEDQDQLGLAHFLE